MLVSNLWTLAHCESPDISSRSPWRWHNSRTRGTTDLRSRTASSISSLPKQESHGYRRQQSTVHEAFCRIHQHGGFDDGAGLGVTERDLQRPGTSGSIDGA